MLRRVALVCALLVVTASCSSDPGAGGGDASNELTPERKRLTWTGSYLSAEQRAYDDDIDQLRAAGETFEFSSSLDESFWDRNPGSVHVGIRWNDPEDLSHEWTGHLFSLYVLDPSGEVAASSKGTAQDVSTAMSVELESPPAGAYEVLVVPNRSSGSTYEGVVFVKPDARGRTLPDLVPQQPTNFTFHIRARGADEDEGGPSCHPMEIAEAPGLKRCLRFDAVIENVGNGPFITESDISEAVDDREETLGEGVEPEGDSVQVLLSPDGDERRVPTGRWVIDKEHQHTHLVDLASFELFPVSGDERGERLLTDTKIGFCPWDLVDERFGKVQSTERRFPAYSCAVPGEREGDAPVVRTIGISAGWSDVYPARRPVQYLDATELADGTYDVVLTVDPNGWYEEGDESNNESATRIEVNGDAISCVPEPYGCPDHFTAGS